LDHEGNEESLLIAAGVVVPGIVVFYMFMLVLPYVTDAGSRGNEVVVDSADQGIGGK